MNADLMVAPRSLPAPHTVFVAGDDAAAKALATDLLQGFGWTADEVVDLGPIAAARGLEHYVRFWVDAMGALGTPAFNIHVVR
jgi:predicted dinucleotide-binding enzyme